MTIKTRTVVVSPRTAKTWLATNRENRTLSPDWVNKLARDMRSGDFPNVGEGIKFDEDGDLIDGQHRLAAVVQSGVSVEFLVVEGVPREHRYKMDKVRKRSTADELTMRFGIPSAAMAVATGRLVLQWEIEEIKSESYKPTDAEIVDCVVQHRDAIGEAVRYGMTLRADLGASPSATAAVHFLTRRIDAATAVEFWHGVHKGSGLVEGDPELTLRNAIVKLNQATAGAKQVKPFLAMLAYAWNAKREGRKIKRLAPKKLAELTDEHFRLA